jgi:4-alpha-glucanotransferase
VTVISAPERTWEPGAEPSLGAAHRVPEARARDYGIFLPLYSLRTARSWGTGDVTDLGALLRWSGRRGARFVGTLPLTATFLGGGKAPVDYGPYVPASRVFWNELYLDVEAAPGLERAPEAQRLLSSPDLREEVRRLREGRRVRYAESMAVKRRVLEAIVQAFAPRGEPLPKPLAEFAAARSEAVPYARFRAAVERLGPCWREWPGARFGSVPAHAPDADPAAHDLDDRAVRYHLYVQWAMALQIAALRDAPGARGGSAGDPGSSPTLYLDLPLGTHPDGFDVWRFGEAFASGLSGGAPPDPFQEQGQDWGFPPLHPERTRQDGHRYLRSCLRHLMRASGMLRLDHVMSLHRLWCIPSGHPPTDGAYVRYPAEELYATLCVESHRWKCEVVGEDLGTVPAEVRDTMERRGLRRMYVLTFEVEVPPPDGRDVRAPASAQDDALESVRAEARPEAADDPASAAAPPRADEPPPAAPHGAFGQGAGGPTPAPHGGVGDAAGGPTPTPHGAVGEAAGGPPEASHGAAGAAAGQPATAPRLAPVHPLSVASLGTHDLPPFAAFTTGVDIERRRMDGAIDQAEAERQQAGRARWFAALKEVVGARPEDGPADVLPLVLRRLARSPAEHLLVNVEDLWGETASQNAPGTVIDENWTLRAAHPLEAWETLPGLEALLASLLRERQTTAPRRGSRWVTPHSERQSERHRVGGNEWPT